MAEVRIGDAGLLQIGPHVDAKRQCPKGGDLDVSGLASGERQPTDDHAQADQREPKQRGPGRTNAHSHLSQASTTTAWSREGTAPCARPGYRPALRVESG